MRHLPESEVNISMHPGKAVQIKKIIDWLKSNVICTQSSPICCYKYSGHKCVQYMFIKSDFTCNAFVYVLSKLFK